MPSRTATSTLTKSKAHVGQVQLQGANTFPPSPSTSPDSFLLDKYRNQASPAAKRFPLKNLRRKIPQPNLHEAASIPSIYHQGHDGTDDRRTSVNLSDLQAKINLLTKNLNSAEAALRKVGDEREEWRERCKTLEQRGRAVTKENRELRTRNAELEALMKKREAPVEENKDAEDEERRKRRNSRSIASSSEEAKATKALITHHWNIQAAKAKTTGKDTDWCECVASRTLRAVMKEGSSKTSPLLQAKGFDEVAKGSLRASDDKLAGPSAADEKKHQEIREEQRRRHKEALKKRIKETRVYVEGLKKENDILEGILTNDGKHGSSRSKDSSGGHGSRRNEVTTDRRKH